MPLDRHTKRLLDIVAVGKTDSSMQSPDAMRQAFSVLAQAVDARDVPTGACENRDISGPAGTIPLRIYSPVTAETGPLPALIYFHGGAGVFCSIETHDGLCRILTNESGCRVISVGYRLAPENKFPAAIDDACAATAWVFAQCEGLDIDPARVGVAGDSAGATLATVVCHRARRKTDPGVTNLGGIALQVLICPVTDPGLDTPSRRAFSQGYFFDMATLDWALGHYLPAGVNFSDARVSPLRAGDLGNLPPAHVHTAEFDPFRDEGQLYAQAMQRAGVPVVYTCHGGMIHHFYCMAGAIPNARTVIKSIGNAVRDAFSEQPAL